VTGGPAVRLIKSKIGLATAIAAFITSQARCEPKAHASYVCTSQVTAGISFNDQDKRWVTTNVTKDEGFDLKINYLGRKIRKLPGIKWSVETYNVSLAKQGENEPTICIDHSTEIAWEIDARDDLLQCVTIGGKTHFQFNLKNNRFLSASLYGYVQGQDNIDDTPAITAGVCTKIN